MLRARRAPQLYALWLASLETAFQPVQGWPSTGRVVCGRLTSPLDTPCHTGLNAVIHLLQNKGKPFSHFS
jgi:hypothetical protein